MQRRVKSPWVSLPGSSCVPINLPGKECCRERDDSTKETEGAEGRFFDTHISYRAQPDAYVNDMLSTGEEQGPPIRLTRLGGFRGALDKG